MEIKDQVAVITGGGSGMGRATAERLSQKGARVALLDVNQGAAEKVASAIQGKAFACNVTDVGSVEKTVQTIVETLGPISICVNCAGIVHGRRMVNQQGAMPLEEFRRVIDINLVGTFNVMSIVAKSIIAAKGSSNIEEHGVIINTASVAAFEGQIGQTAYSASKGGIVALTLPAARELAQFGIRVMTIAPGLVDTPMFEKISDEARASLAAQVPFPKRLAKAEEFASLVIHIIENPMLNGGVIRLDGALRMQPK